MRFLIDECLHTSLVGVAQGKGREAHHVNWLGLSGETDRGLMPRIIEGDFTFVTNNAIDFRALYKIQPVHAGLLIIVPNVPPNQQRQIFQAALDYLGDDAELVNEAIELHLENGDIRFDRYAWPAET